MELYTAAQMKEIDRVAIQERGIPSTLLMERAAKALVQEVLALPFPQKKKNRTLVWSVKDGCMPSAEEQAKSEAEFWAKQQRSAVVFCGPGNNGGDGVASARFLLREGWKVKCVLVGKREKMTDDCREMERRLIEAGGILEDFDPEKWAEYSNFDVAIDALFGVGLNSDLRPDALEAVRMMKSTQWVVSADVPSGIHADTGEVLGRAVQADVTVTFSAGKPGLYVGQGAVHSGRVVVADIGIPRDLMDRDASTTSVVDRPRLPRRRRDAHKGNFGRLFILAGSVGYTGAPVLASRAAVRGGAGLVTLAVPQEIYPIVAVKCDEAMPWPWPDSDEKILEKAKSCDAALIGPGLGQGERAERLVLSLLRELTCPVILDADGLNILARHIDVLDKREGLTILTPHDGEFARLSGCALPIADRLSVAREFAGKHKCILVLKGHRTITAAWNGRCFINPTGNPGMARGGSGDALAGLMAGLVAQKSVGNNGILYAVWFHGRAGDLAAADKGEYGMTVGDLIEQIPYAMKECEEE
ncbi:MAG: NAD(P)H-hydrate dehydratase [Oscillospiraceae bacterium]